MKKTKGAKKEIGKDGNTKAKARPSQFYQWFFTLNNFTKLDILHLKMRFIKIMQDVNAPHQQFNVENKGQFKVLWSRTGILSNQNTNAQYLKTLKFYVKPSLKTFYSNGIDKANHIFFFGYTGVEVINNPPSISIETRIRYTDS